MDLTGRFPKRDLRGNECILIVYHFDGNHKYGIPIKSRKGHVIRDAYKELHRVFKQAGAAPKMMVLHNEISTDLMKAFDEENIFYQLVTAYKYRKIK